MRKNAVNYIYKELKSDQYLDSLECGCIIFQRTDTAFGRTRALIQYCPKHSAAPIMYKALKRFLESSACTNGCKPDDMTCDTNFARHAIAIADGKLNEKGGEK
jgi:hypothetical protein